MYLICGEALFDLFLDGGDGLGAARFDARAGGSPFNVAIGVSRLGGRAGLLGGLSRDMLGERLEGVLEAEGVDTRYLVRSERPTTLSVVGVNAHGQPAYAFYGQGSADTGLAVTDLPEPGAEVFGLHFGSYSLAVPPVADALAALAERERARFVSLDPNVRPTVEPDMDVWRARIEVMLSVADLVKVSDEDLAHLYPGVDVDAVAREWLARGPQLVVVTAGEGAARAFSPVEEVSVRPPAAEVVDTVGAGDTFQAALLVGLAEGGDPAAALGRLRGDALRALLTRAARAAAVTCSRRGADMARADEVR